MKIIASVLVCAGVSIAVVFAVAHAEKVRAVSREQAEAAAVGVLTQVTALDRLRAGDTAGAIEMLEVSLDSNITILGGSDEVRREPNVRKILQRAAEYRVNHPRKSDPTLDAHVSELLKPYQKGQQ